MKRSLAAFAATLVCVSALTTTPASADTTKPNDTDLACALSLDDGALTCVDNEEDLYSAVYTQTGDIVAPVNSATPSLLKAASTSVVVAQFWDDTSYSGSTFMMYRSKGCSSYPHPVARPTSVAHGTIESAR